MAEPTSTKLTVFAALTAVVGPLAAEYSLILAGAIVGAFVSLSLRPALPGWWRPLQHTLLGVLLAMVFTPVGAVVAVWALPDGLELTVEALLPLVACGIGAFWHQALQDWGPAVAGRVFSRWLGRRDGDGGQ